jgi:hypothetical protein
MTIEDVSRPIVRRNQSVQEWPTIDHHSGGRAMNAGASMSSVPPSSPKRRRNIVALNAAAPAVTRPTLSS